jgi:hypothetical protein
MKYSLVVITKWHNGMRALLILVIVALQTAEEYITR